MKLRLTLALAATLPALAYAEKNPVLPPPFATPSVNRQAEVIGWPTGKTPVAASGFKVELFAELPAPRSLYLLPNGDVLVSQAEKHPDDQGEKSPDQITRFKMEGSKLVGTEVFAKDLHLPFGMALWKDEFFVAEPTRVLKFRYDGERLAGSGVPITTIAFPKPQRHWTRHLLLSKDGNDLYVSSGSASNVGEDNDPLDPETAAILVMKRDGSEKRIFASGIRNPVMMAWEPRKGALWAVVNERDELGDDLVPDYITAVQKDGFYGWPFAYWGKNEDPRQAGKRPDLVEKSIVPDYSVGPHTASLGISFTATTKVPAPFNEGALIAQHGSWNRSQLSGYKVHYVPFVNGEAVDGESEFLTGFIADPAKGTVHGRPVSTLVLGDGSVLVSDDAGGRIWRVSRQ